MDEVAERLATLEANDANIFHQLKEVKDDIKDVHRLATAVETIAIQTKNTSEKVDDISERMNRMEEEPAEDMRYYKRTITGCVITGVIGAVLGAIIALILK